MPGATIAKPGGAPGIEDIDAAGDIPAGGIPADGIPAGGIPAGGIPTGTACAPDRADSLDGNRRCWAVLGGVRAEEAPQAGLFLTLPIDSTIIGRHTRFRWFTNQ